MIDTEQPLYKTVRQIRRLLEEDFTMGKPIPFCTCSDTACPFNPVNHDLGCTPCIAKNLKELEIPTCFFKAVGHPKPTSEWHFEDFAALVRAAMEDKAE